MKSMKIIFAAAFVVTAAAYARAAGSAGTPAAPGQSIIQASTDTDKLAALPLDMIAAKVKGAKDKNEKGQYVRALYRFKPKGEKDIATLANLAAEDNGRGVASGAAFRAMENLGPEDKALAPAFVKLLNHKNGRVQYLAMEKCGLLRSKEALPKLIEGLRNIGKNANAADDEWRIRGLMSGLGKYGKDGLPGLLELHKETNSEIVGKFTLGAIHSITDKESLPQFMEIVRNKNEDFKIREVAVQMVGKLGAKENVAELIEIFKGEKVNSVQYYLIEAVGNSKSETALPFLQEILNKDSDESNRAGAAHALEKIGGPKVIQVLEGALKIEHEATAKMAIVYSLKRLTGNNYDRSESNEK